MAVAKSYQNLELIKQPYCSNGRMYVQVKMLNGTTKQVRWYSDEEYQKLYGDFPSSVSKPQSPKEALGFKNDSIIIFKGDTYPLKDWFKSNGAHYNKFLGWTFETLPADIPADLEMKTLLWSSIGNEDGTLKSDEQIKKAINDLMYDPDNSTYVGTPGDRIELTLTVEKTFNLNSFYGMSTMHIFRDTNGNAYVWTTASRHWDVGSIHTLRATIKDHREYRNIKQTILTRCVEIKEK